MFGLISQLAHVEFFSPKPDETVAYLIDVLGMEHSEDHGDSVYLRGWGDYFHHSVVVKPGPAPALSHVAWRAAGEEQLKTAVARLEEKGAGEGWFDETPGHGPAFRFRSPGGHLHEVFWEVERYQAPEHMRSTYPIRPQRFAPRGAAVRQLDHITYPTLNILTDVEWFRDVLGFRWMESARTDPDRLETIFFVEMSNTEQAHDLGLLHDASGIPGRMHHFAMWLDQHVDVLRAADVILEAGHPIEYGPGKHGHGENACLYVREPGGMRIELFSGGYRNYQPDWEPAHWLPQQGSADMYRNLDFPDSMLEVFPTDDAAPQIAISEEEEGAVNPWAFSEVVS